MKTKQGEIFRRQWRVTLLVCLTLSLLAGEVLAAAKPSLTLSKASWSAKTNQLLIQGSLKNTLAGTAVTLYDIDGRSLGTVTPTKPAFSFTLSGTDLPSIPCSIRAQAGALEQVKAVAGNTNKACTTTPTCQITAVNNSKVIGPITVSANTDVSFTALAKFSNKKAQPKYEWDFAGGAMGINDSSNAAVDSYKRATGTNATVKFIRDNSHYRVHFSAVDGSVAAMESRQYRCEDTIDVTVGSPPAVGTGASNIPDMSAMVSAAQQSVPKLQKDANGNPRGNRGDLVVLPYEDLTMQCVDDARLSPAASVANESRYGSLNAVVYQKDLKSPTITDVVLQYAAASNPNDPVGANSINSTSQNWPLGTDIRKATSPMMSAQIRKSDRWESEVLTANGGLDLQFFFDYGIYPTLVTPDEGFYNLQDPKNSLGWPSSVVPPFVDAEHGRRMPGFDAPYVNNTPQDFSGYLSELNAFQARWLPLSDVDDSNQVNPFPLLRVQAFDAGDSQRSQPLATTDAVQTSGRDFHCRECHTKGKIGAADSGNANQTWTPDAQSYSTYNDDLNQYGLPPGTPQNSASFTPPIFYDSVDVNGKPSTDIFDQEYAALRNMTNLHDFYDTLGMQLYGTGFQGAIPCGDNCHTDTNNQRQNRGSATRWGAPDPEQVFPLPNQSPYGGGMDYDVNYSMNMHKWHGTLQYNDKQDGILRDTRGVPERWDPQAPVNAGKNNTRSLFPVKDPVSGAILPMEQNCLKCHAGQREQCYRDRMFTAGVTCYQCHGDMLAVGKAYAKQVAGSDGHGLRSDLQSQPDCGSCHVGTANVGKSDTNFFSAGVRKLAFAPEDPSATTLPVDWSNPDTSRFAVPTVPVESPRLEVANNREINASSYIPDIVRVDAPLYRLGQDVHGKVPCGACHGGAHAVWPNRDPSANDNVTALQLQGHTGTILECNVCHSADAFNTEDSNGSVVHYPDKTGKPTILAGPHNIHPINDPNWYKNENPGRVANKDGTTYGGWHNSFAKKPGLGGEDQCAACHGNDHNGTRLSRTPVDRTFDFSKFDPKKLKQAGFKKTVIQVAAGSFIGCNTCHSVKTSCTQSPAGDQCGKASTVSVVSSNHSPQFTGAPTTDATQFIVGQTKPYSYTPTTNDADGDGLTFGLSTRLDAMQIDPVTGVVTVSDWNAIYGSGAQLPYTYTYIVTVSDGNGGSASQKVPVTNACPDGQVWGYSSALSGNACLVNHAPTLQVPPLPTAVVGTPFRLTFVSVDPDHKGNIQNPLYTLSGQPTGMTLGQTNGVLNWCPDSQQDVTFTVRVEDQVGGTDSQAVTLHVCGTGQTFSVSSSSCVINQSPSITSTSVAGLNLGDLYSYPVSATDPDGDAVTFSLFGAPDGMSMDANSNVISLTPTVSGSFSFTLVATDSKGGLASQPVSVTVCGSGQHWDPMGMCM